MYSIERVRRAIHLEEPDRVPIMRVGSAFDLLFRTDVHPMTAVPSKKYQPGWSEDEIGIFPHFDYPIGWKWKEPDWAKTPKYKNLRNQPHEEIDWWGCIWNVSGKKDTMGHPGRPSLPDWSKLDAYIDRFFPDPEDKGRFTLSLRLNRLLSRLRYRVIMPTYGPFHISANMRGFINFLIDHRKQPEKVKYLLEQITNNFIKEIKMFVKLGGKPHGVFMYEDLGDQQNPFISPAMFKEFYEPVYRRLFDTAHDFGGEFHLHCCGKIDKLIPLLIDWGLDALELDSPRMTGYPALKPFRGKIMIWGCVNIQSIYVKGTPEEVEREVWHMMRNLGTPKGGCGFYFYPQSHDIQTPQENIKAFARGTKKFGRYSKIPVQWWDYPTVEEWDYNKVPPLPPINE
jgi:uroporphyrinogen decarboxylase